MRSPAGVVVMVAVAVMAGVSMGEAFMDLAAVDSMARALVAGSEDLVDRARALRL